MSPLDLFILRFAEDGAVSIECLRKSCRAIHDADRRISTLIADRLLRRFGRDRATLTRAGRSALAAEPTVLRGKMGLTDR